MLICKVCGTANSPDSSVCVNCGKKLRAKLKKADTDGQVIPKKNGVKHKKKTSGKKISEKENIFSDTSKEAAQADDNNLFSSSEALEKSKLSNVHKKIKQFEKQTGEFVLTEIEETPVVPIVINDSTLSDLTELTANDGSTAKAVSQTSSGGHRTRTTRTTKERADNDGTIPSRHINNTVKLKSGTRYELKNAVRRDDKVYRSVPIEDVIDDESEPVGSDSFVPDSMSDTKTMEIKLVNKKYPKKTSVNTGEIAEDKTAEIKLPKRHKEIAADTAAEDVITEEKTAEIKLPKKRKEISADTAQDESGVTSEEKTVGEPVKKKKKTKIDDAVDIVKTEAVLADEAKSSGIDTSEEMKEKISEDIADEKVEERVIGARQIPHVAEDISSTPKEEKSKKKKKQKHSEAKTTEKNPQDKKSGGEPVEFDDDDIAENSTVAALSYLGLLIILPLMKADESPFCKAHSKQGIRVFVYSIIVMLATLALVLGLRALVVWVLGWSFVIYRILQFAVTAAMVILLIIPAFRGAVGAFSGEYRKVPFVGVDALKKKK